MSSEIGGGGTHKCEGNSGIKPDDTSHKLRKSEGIISQKSFNSNQGKLFGGNMDKRGL
jgi:hypothetical protein